MLWNLVEYKRRLLHRTLRYAQRSVPFYRDLLQGRDPFSLTLQDFPLVDAATIRNRYQDFVVLDRFPDFYHTTGGSTGEITLIPGMLAELESAFRYRTGMRPNHWYTPDQYNDALIHLISIEHGPILDPPHGQPVIKLPVNNYRHVDIIKDFIEHGIRIGGRNIPVTGLMGERGKLKALTTHLLGDGYDSKRSTIRFLRVYGAHLSQVWRQRLTNYWEAEVINTFGLTEFSYDVVAPCPHCSNYHFDLLHHEYWLPDRSGPCSTGDAVLVLTSTVPFSRCLPRIRYWTDDVVRIGEPCDVAAGDRGFTFLGRLNRCVARPFHGAYTALLSPRDIVEVVDGLEDAALTDLDIRPSYIGGRREVQGSVSPGDPKHHLRIGPNSAELLLEVTFDPDREPARAASVRDQVLAGLAELSPHCLRALESNGIDFLVTILPPSGLLEQGLVYHLT